MPALGSVALLSSTEIPLIVSNHRDFQDVAVAQNIPFVHLPVSGQNKMEQEARLAALLEDYKIDLVVLARYMQILSDSFCKQRMPLLLSTPAIPKSCSALLSSISASICRGQWIELSCTERARG